MAPAGRERKSAFVSCLTVRCDDVEDVDGEPRTCEVGNEGECRGLRRLSNRSRALRVDSHFLRAQLLCSVLAARLELAEFSQERTFDR